MVAILQKQTHIGLDVATKGLSDKANRDDILWYFVMYFHMDFDLYANCAPIVNLCTVTFLLSVCCLVFSCSLFIFFCFYFRASKFDTQYFSTVILLCSFSTKCCSIEPFYRLTLAVMHTILIRVCKQEMMYVLSARCSLTDFRALAITEAMTDMFLTNGIRRCLQIHQPSSSELTLSTHFERTKRNISIQLLNSSPRCFTVRKRSDSSGSCPVPQLMCESSAHKGLVKVPHLSPVRLFTIHPPPLRPTVLHSKDIFFSFGFLSSVSETMCV